MWLDGGTRGVHVGLYRTVNMSDVGATRGRKKPKSNRGRGNGRGLPQSKVQRENVTVIVNANDGNLSRVKPPPTSSRKIVLSKKQGIYSFLVRTGIYASA